MQATNPDYLQPLYQYVRGTLGLDDHHEIAVAVPPVTPSSALEDGSSAVPAIASEGNKIVIHPVVINRAAPQYVVCYLLFRLLGSDVSEDKLPTKARPQQAKQWLKAYDFPAI